MKCDLHPNIENCGWIFLGVAHHLKAIARTTSHRARVEPTRLRGLELREDDFSKVILTWSCKNEFLQDGKQFSVGAEQAGEVGVNDVGANVGGLGEATS